MTNSKIASAATEYANLCAEYGTDPIAEQNAILSIGREFLPECAVAVLDGSEPTVEFYAFLASQTEQAQADSDREVAAGYEATA